MGITFGLGSVQLPGYPVMQASQYVTTGSYAHIPASTQAAGVLSGFQMPGAYQPMLQQMVANYSPAEGGIPSGFAMGGSAFPAQPTVGAPPMLSQAAEEDQHLDRLLSIVIDKLAEKPGTRHCNDLMGRVAALVYYAFGREGQSFDALTRWQDGISGEYVNSTHEQGGPPYAQLGPGPSQPGLFSQKAIVNWAHQQGYMPGRHVPNFQQQAVQGFDPMMAFQHGENMPAGSYNPSSLFAAPMVGV